MPQSDSKSDARLGRERQTIAAMIGLYCRGHHRGRPEPCAECADLLQYALARLDRCPFAAEKPTCARCPIHCYSPTRRDQIKRVMRYAGPRMIVRHPLLAIRHQLDRLCRRNPKQP